MTLPVLIFTFFATQVLIDIHLSFVDIQFKHIKTPAGIYYIDREVINHVRYEKSWEEY